MFIDLFCYFALSDKANEGNTVASVRAFTENLFKICWKVVRFWDAVDECEGNKWEGNEWEGNECKGNEWERNELEVNELEEKEWQGNEWEGNEWEENVWVGN